MFSAMDEQIARVAKRNKEKQMSQAPEKTFDETAKEILDRCRRIETRLTKFLEQQGFDTETRRPVFHSATSTLDVPSPEVSLKDCLAAVPQHWTALITVEHKGGEILRFYR
jgi:hypothetical protein